MFCTKCGANVGTNKFCTQCGTPVLPIAPSAAPERQANMEKLKRYFPPLLILIILLIISIIAEQAHTGLLLSIVSGHRQREMCGRVQAGSLQSREYIFQCGIHLSE